VLRQALPTAAIWLAFVIALDLPPVLASSGLVFACVFAWWDEQKRRAAEVDEQVCAEELPSYDEDEPFEEHPLVFYV
jgi:hypothetical protein